MKLDIQLKTMKESHLDEVLLIEKSSFKYSWNRRLFMEELGCRDAYNFIAVRKNERSQSHIVGYLCFRLLYEEMQLMRLAVAPDKRRQGIGGLMLLHSFDVAEQKGGAVCFLEVNQSNTSAIQLYKKFGFDCIGKRPGYYPEIKEDGLVFKKQLKGLQSVKQLDSSLFGSASEDNKINKSIVS